MMGSLTDETFLRQLLAHHDIVPQRSSGQNFLVCEEAVEATLAVLQDSPKHITELGAGVGTLTVPLAANGFRVRAIERDKTLADILEKQLPKKLRERVEIVADDLREVDWVWEKPYALVGNIPYNLSGWIIRNMTQLSPAPAAVVLLVQAEVADRILAQPPDMNLLGLSVQLWGSATRLLSVPASCFWPKPEVASSLVLLEPKPTSQDDATKREELLKFAKQFFQTKRKQVGGILKRITGAKEDEIARILAGVGIAPQARPQEISLAQWRKLYDTV